MKSRQQLFTAAQFLSLWRQSAVDRRLSVKPRPVQRIVVEESTQYKWLNLLSTNHNRSRRKFWICFVFSEKTSLDISCESSARQMIHMKSQDLFCLKSKKKIYKNLECRLLQILHSPLRITIRNRKYTGDLPCELQTHRITALSRLIVCILL